MKKLRSAYAEITFPAAKILQTLLHLLINRPASSLSPDRPPLSIPSQCRLPAICTNPILPQFDSRPMPRRTLPIKPDHIHHPAGQLVIIPVRWRRQRLAVRRQTTVQRRHGWLYVRLRRGRAAVQNQDDTQQAKDDSFSHRQVPSSRYQFLFSVRKFCLHVQSRLH